MPASATPEVPALALAADGRRVWVSQGRTAIQAYTLAGQPTGPVLGTWDHPNRWLRPVLDPAGRAWLLSDRAAYCPAPAGHLVEVVC